MTILNLTVIKEANQLTEQFYSVGVFVSTPTIGLNPATLETLEEFGDYSLGYLGVSFQQLPFRSDMQEFPFFFYLFGDDIAEGTEDFWAIIAKVEGTPRFQDPTTASLTTTIKILDDDCKLSEIGYTPWKSMVMCLCDPCICSFHQDKAMGEKLANEWVPRRMHTFPKLYLIKTRSHSAC